MAPAISIRPKRDVAPFPKRIACPRCGRSFRSEGIVCIEGLPGIGNRVSVVYKASKRRRRKHCDLCD